MDTKVALVTGSSDGIGASVAKLLGERGYSTVVTYKTGKDRAEQIVEEIVSKGGLALALELDVTSEESVKNCFEVVREQFGQLDVLVNNAGVDHLSPIEDCSFELWQDITRTKIDGNFLCIKYGLPLLKEVPKSDLLIVMSSLGDRPDPEDIAYSVGTAATVCFVKVMALALAKYGVRTNGVGPSATRTNLGYYEDKELTADTAWDEMAKSNPLGRVTSPEDVAETVLTIIENKTQFWNGNFVYVSGGSHLQ